MAYSLRCHPSAGPMKLNRTSWGPVTAPPPLDLPNKVFGRPLSGNFDRIINTFDRTNAFECVRSAFEQASKEHHQQLNQKQQPQQQQQKHQQQPLTHRIETTVVAEKKDDDKSRFQGCGDIVVNHIGSSYERADVGLATRQTPCNDEEVTEYYRDRLYMSQARQLFPLQEDLADWINKTIGITHLTGENFLNALDNGVELLQLAAVIRDKAKEATDSGIYHGPVPQVRGRCWQRAARRSFFSRDNMENFITFCRQLGVHENLLFESDDLVLHAQPRNVILCLLELARIATKFKVEPPGLVQLEKEIALEEAGIAEGKDMRLGATLAWQFQQDGDANKPGSDVETSSAAVEEESSLPATCTLFNNDNEDNTSIQTDETWSRATSEDLEGVPLKPLSELDKRVQIVTRLMQRNCNCSEGKCSKLLKVKKVGEGRYNIAGRNVFIRLLKGRHMMVRVGGGWDTLEHFLTRHDPCQVRVISSHSSSTIQKVTTVDITQQPKMLDTASIENAIRDSLESHYNGSHHNNVITICDPGLDSVSDTSSVNSTTGSNASAKVSNGKGSHSSGKSTPTSVKSSSISLRYSGSGRTTPQSAGRTSPRSSKSPSLTKVSSSDVKSNANSKMSPSNLKLDLSSPANGRRIKSSSVINNRMISPIESSARLLPASAKHGSQSRNVRTPVGDSGRKSFPNCTESQITTRRRSLNLTLTSATKSPAKLSRSQNAKSPASNGSSTNSLLGSGQVKSVAPPASPTKIENSPPKLVSPMQASPQSKSFLHIRAKYRSPPPRDIPPREL